MKLSEQEVAVNAPQESTQAGKATPQDMANAIRALAMDAVQAANSGHPGMPMGMADIAVALFAGYLKFDAAAPDWPDRDRLVVSNGHGSMLLYALLHLTGYADMDIGQIRRFRQLGSRTAGHPEYGHAKGIETTTGPLGQGFANAVGMALAERMLAAEFGEDLFDHHTYVLAGDGCLMEGISHEAASLAGHLELGKLIVLFDDNHISIDGPLGLTESSSQMDRFRAYGWHVQSVDGHAPEALAAALDAARAAAQPSFIACRTVIGYGSPNKQGTAATHGNPLGADEIAATREALGWPYGPFEIPAHILAAWRKFGARGGARRSDWERRVAALPADRRAELQRRLAGDPAPTLAAALADYKRGLSETKPKLATRVASQNALAVIVANAPEMVGGSADLTGSNGTLPKGMPLIAPGDFAGRYIHYGVREHGMAAIMNGLALHGGFIPYGGTFLVFSDYCRPSIRLSALMGKRVVYVMTHDSIGLGEDGPTHQPVEHLAALRAIPNLQVFRPADAVETAECWAVALASAKTPSVLALTRQNLPTVRTTHSDDNLSARGAYVLKAATGTRRATILATGSEVPLALDAQDRLQAEGIPAAVVSMPCLELFDAQDADYRRSVLGDDDDVRVGVEAAVRLGWDRYLGGKGTFVGMRGFGASAPAEELYEHFGITAATVVEAVRSRL